MCMQYFVFQDGFKRLTQEERMTFYQSGPETSRLNALEKKIQGVNRFQHSNFYIEWPILKQAIAKAIAAIRSGERLHDMDQ